MIFFFCLLFSSLRVATFGNIQFLPTKNQMQWKIADNVCAKEFTGSGYTHLAADIPEGTRDFNLNTLENYRSVWLDNLAYDLGCRGDICSLVVIRHRRKISHDFKHLCTNENGTVVIEKYCKLPKIANITSPYMVWKLRNGIPRFERGEEFIINHIDFQGSTDLKCEMARKIEQEFRKTFTRCNEFHKALCEHHTNPSAMVTTIEYREDTKMYKSIFIPHPASPGGTYPMEGKEKGLTDIVWASLSVAVAVMSLFLCAGFLIFCKRKKMNLNSIYDTVFMRPRGRNPYTLRVPNGPTTPITEPANVLIPPGAPAARPEQPPPRVDSVQTLASSTSFGTASTSSSYVDDVRYYRNFSYETQASVATSQVPRIEIQPSTPSMSGRLYCSSCRRHRRKRDFQRMSSNCTSCSSQYSSYTQPARPAAHRNLSQDTNDTNSLRSQRSSRDTNDSRSGRSHRSHRSGRSHRSVLSKISRHKSQADHLSVEQTVPTVSPAASQDDVRVSNPVIRKHKLADRLGSSSGIRLVKRMFSIDLK